MDDTTISFDFSNYINPNASIVDPSLSQQAQLPPPQQLQSPILPEHYGNSRFLDDSTSSDSLIWINANGPHCDPFIHTPEPTISPPVFEEGDLLPYEQMEPDHSKSITQNELNYELPSVLSLLPLLPSQAIPANSEEPVHQPLTGGDVLPAFEMVFLNNLSYEQYMALQGQPRCELVMVHELSPYDTDGDIVMYEQL